MLIYFRWLLLSSSLFVTLQPFTLHTVNNRTMETLSISFGRRAVGQTPQIIAESDLLSAVVIQSSCCLGNQLLMGTTVCGHKSERMTTSETQPAPEQNAPYRNQSSSAVSAKLLGSRFSGVSAHAFTTHITKHHGLNTRM